MFHPRLPILVLDNAPSSCVKTRRTVEAAGGAYLHRPDLVGTSASRDHLFRACRTPWLLVCDSHVMLVPGAIKALLGWIEGHLDSPDMVQGPMLHEDGVGISTHWRQTHPPGLWGEWSTDPRGLEPDAAAFDVPMQGLGAFAMRCDRWPGFNPLFRGFGVEEGYIHEKVRRAGGRTLCLPALRWLHYFRDGEPPPYPLRLEDPVRNLLIGHRELGINATAQIRASLAAPLSDASFVSLVKEAERCQVWKGEPNMGCGCKQESIAPSAVPSSMIDWFTKLHATATGMSEHMPLLRELAAGKVVADATGREAALASLASAEPRRLIALAGAPERAAATMASVLAEDVDLLLDTADVSYDILNERSRHVRARIALLGAANGLPLDIRRFVREFPEWTVWKHFSNNNGLTILSRDPEDKKPLPGIVKQAWNYGKALAAHAAAGAQMADERTVALRLAVCDLCDQRNGNRCGACGCFLDEHDGKQGKAQWQESVCPLGKWPG